MLKLGKLMIETKFITYAGGGHFHIARDMDVRQIRVWFFTLKSGKRVF